jgi:hypothetical protein
VDFPRHPNWNGLLTEMERVAPGRGLACVGERVRVRSDLVRPSYGWGPVVERGAVGEVVRRGQRHGGGSGFTLSPRLNPWPLTPDP